jgi:serine/threonine-protein kinase HipA
MAKCLICLAGTRGNAEFHERCLDALFGQESLPALAVEPANLYSLAAKMAGKMSISGAQEKISLALSADRKTLEPSPSGGRYILKPEPSRFSSLPENEHVTMRLASLAGIETPPFGLVRMQGGSLAYLMKRFDRLDDGTKLHVEDFCQLAEKPMRDKCQGSAESCVRILRKYASEPLIEIRRLYQLLLFSWWVSNGDQHLKNFSLLMTPDGYRRLSPAYDQICTRLVLPDDDLALTLSGKKKNITRRMWLNFAEYCEIPERAAKRVIGEQTDVLDEALDLIARSFLPERGKTRYEEILRENTAVLSV